MVDKDDTKHSAASFHSAEQANAEANLKRQEANAFCLQTCQWMVHWMYDSCVSLRRHIRQEICEKASALGTTTMSRLDKGICMPSSNRTGASTTSGAILSRDAGSSRMHTKPLLEVLLTILSGLQTSSNSVSGNGSNSGQLRRNSKEVSHLASLSDNTRNVHKAGFRSQRQ